MKMRTGTMVGKNDSRLNGIKVGDQLRSNLIDLVGHVDNYGCICFPNGDKVAPTKWDGADYTIVSGDEVNAVDEPALDIVEPEVAKEEEPAKKQRATIGMAMSLNSIMEDETYDRSTGDDWPLREQVAYWKGKYEEITIAEFDATTMVAELRHRGYDVTCTRTIVEAL